MKLLYDPLFKFNTYVYLLEYWYEFTTINKMCYVYAETDNHRATKQEKFIHIMGLHFLLPFFFLQMSRNAPQLHRISEQTPGESNLL